MSAEAERKKQLAETVAFWKAQEAKDHYQEQQRKRLEAHRVELLRNECRKCAEKKFQEIQAEAARAEAARAEAERQRIRAEHLKHTMAAKWPSNFRRQ